MREGEVREGGREGGEGGREGRYHVWMPIQDQLPKT